MTVLPGLCAIALVAFAPPQTYKVSRVLRDGQVLRYVVTRSAAKGNDSLLLGGGGVWNVELRVSACEDGETTVNAVRTAVKLDAENSPYTPEEVIRRMRQPLKAVIVVHRNGSVEMLEGQRTTSEFACGTPWYEDVLLARLPDHSVAKNETWTGIHKVPSLRSDEPTMDQVFKYRLHGRETVDGVPCLKITMSSILDRRLDANPKPSPGEQATGIKLTLHSEVRYTVFIACRDGRVIENSGIEKTTIDSAGGPIPIHNTSAMKLLVKRKEGG